MRDAIIARVFGAGLMTDAFFVAFKIPNLLRRLFAEGAFSQAFVPILAEYKNQRGPEATRALIDHISGLLALALALVTAVGVIAAPLLIYLTAPGFSANAEKFELTVDLLRITFPYILFISLTALAGGILNTYSRFSVPALTPALLNVSFIVFALWVAPYFDPPVLALAWAVFIGGVLQLAFQVPLLARLKLLPRFRLDLRDEGVTRVLRQMGPAVFGVSIGQLSLVINNIFASFLLTGSVSWLYYADRLMEFPMGLLGVALGTILLPSLSKHHATRSAEDYSRLLDWGLRMTLLLAVPAAAALALLAVPLVTTLFQYGAFSATDTLATRNAVVALQRRARPTHPGEGARARFLRPAEHPDAGKSRRREPGHDAASESCADRPIAPRRARARHQPGCLRERGTSLRAAAPERHLQPAVGLVAVRAEARSGGVRNERRALVRRGEHGGVVACGGI